MTLSYSRKNSNCRLCKGEDLSKVLGIPSSQPVDGFRPHSHAYLNLPRFNMDLYMCNKCGHHQLLDVVDPKILYGSYIYTSSSSPDLKKHFLNYSLYLQKKGCINKDSIVLDVGCNDGLFLNYLEKFSKNLFGIDPAPNIIDSSKSSNYNLFSGYCNNNNIAALKKKYNIEKFDLITANNVFAHADNLEEMLSSISYNLQDNGYFCFEVSYIYDLVNSNVVDYIYHEHLSYHGIKSLKQFLKRNSLYIADIERIDTKGGSIRVLATKNYSLENSELINDFIDLENSVDCYSKKSFKLLQIKLDSYKKELIKLLDKYSSDSNPLFCYGASPTSIVNGLLLGYEKKIGCFLDDNNLRHNLLSPNILVPVLDPIILKNYTNPIVIIGAWRFADLIINKINNINANTRIIVPSLDEGIKSLNFEK